MYRFKTLIFDVVNGIRSRIPFCCVLYFCIKRFVRPGNPVFLNAAIERNDNLRKARYVQCNKCYYSNKLKNINSKNGVIFKKLILK